MGLEILSRMLRKEEFNGLPHGIQLSRASPSISHLLFADDTIRFAGATHIEAACIKDCLEKSSIWSGQSINCRKSSIFFSKNCKAHLKQEVLSILQFQQAPTKARYLGLPINHEFRKKQWYEGRKEKVLNRIAGWKAKVLSQAARTT